MPAKKPTKSKSRVQTKSKKGGFKFRWWMAAILVAVVALAGFVAVRYSFASDFATTYRDKYLLYCADGYCYGGSEAHLVPRATANYIDVYDLRRRSDGAAVCPHGAYFPFGWRGGKDLGPYACVLKRGN